MTPHLRKSTYHTTLAPSKSSDNLRLSSKLGVSLGVSGQVKDVPSAFVISHCKNVGGKESTFVAAVLQKPTVCSVAFFALKFGLWKFQKIVEKPRKSQKILRNSREPQEILDNPRKYLKILELIRKSPLIRKFQKILGNFRNFRFQFGQFHQGLILLLLIIRIFENIIGL